LKKSLKITLGAAGIAALSIGAAAFLIAPGRSRKRAKAQFFGRNYARRGLHLRDNSIVENSLSAFRAAADNGYGMELDVQLSSDDQLVVFHDESLLRVCGTDADVGDRTWAELQEMKLFDTNEHIPLLSEVFAVVDGRTPIMLALRSGRKNDLLCRKTLDLIDRYPGPVCIESFDPMIVRWFRLHAPDILRGQISSRREDLIPDCSPFKAFCTANLLTNFLGRPQFIAYHVGKKPLTVKLCEAMGAMKVLWTSHDWTNEPLADAVIFEYYRPRRKFK